MLVMAGTSVASITMMVAMMMILVDLVDQPEMLQMHVRRRRQPKGHQDQRNDAPNEIHGGIVDQTIPLFKVGDSLVAGLLPLAFVGSIPIRGRGTGMLGAPRLGQRQNPSPQDLSEFSDRLSGGGIAVRGRETETLIERFEAGPA